MISTDFLNAVFDELSSFFDDHDWFMSTFYIAFALWPFLIIVRLLRSWLFSDSPSRTKVPVKMACDHVDSLHSVKEYNVPKDESFYQ